MKRDIPERIQLAVEYAAHDVSSAVADEFGAHGSITQIRRNITSMIRAAVSGAINGVVREASWVDITDTEQWLSRSGATGTGGLDSDVLPVAIREWWDSLDEAGKYRAISKNHKDTEFIQQKTQYYQNRSESELAKEDPRLLETYRSKVTTSPKIPTEERAPAAQPPSAAPAPAPGPVPEAG